MYKHEFNGPFKNYIKEFIALKQAMGYKYANVSGDLKRFDTFTVKFYGTEKYLTKEIVTNWCTKKPHEKQQNLCTRASRIRQLAIYINNLGNNAYIIPKNYFKSGEKYIPHIYNEVELKRFFHETDKCKYRCEFPYRHLIMPIFFRMIYTCGLRLSEARLLKVKDVDLKNGILTINQSKNDNSRLVPMPLKITKKCIEYSKYVHRNSTDEHFYFPALNNKPMTILNTYKNFRKFLWKAGISHGGKGKGPRIHDFRHTYAVGCLKKWSLEGKDLMVYLPILRVYLGHNSFAETAYYLKMTSDVFPEITLKLESTYKDLIPEIERGEYESK